ncbi:hypothetical protein [Paenibacillus pabuli]|uniref:hypothetical protein n=1 Tax=Paenibacillus pabuli TaxID=1472 RepID=UPI001FFFA3A1|nr:hypothetical protein [Paenibacillus pabuli]UPK41185.1 hypothetical protein KET34_17885 [Paenibacillus pabuli]
MVITQQQILKSITLHYDRSIISVFLGTIGSFLLVALLVFLFLKSNTEMKSNNAEVKLKSFRLAQNRDILLPYLILILLYTALFITNNLGGTTSDVGLVSMN